MPTTVNDSDRFKKDLRRLVRKYPKVSYDVDTLITTLENDQRPGDAIPDVGYEVYKVRLANPSAERGKSGGFRVIYYVRLADTVILLTIYSKTEQTDIGPDEIRQLLGELQHPDQDNDTDQ